jgi:hypothetical protein
MAPILPLALAGRCNAAINKRASRDRESGNMEAMCSCLWASEAKVTELGEREA